MVVEAEVLRKGHSSNEKRQGAWKESRRPHVGGESQVVIPVDPESIFAGQCDFQQRLRKLAPRRQFEPPERRFQIIWGQLPLGIASAELELRLGASGHGLIDELLRDSHRQ